MPFVPYFTLCLLVSVSDPCDVTDGTLILTGTAVILGHTHLQNAKYTPQYSCEYPLTTCMFCCCRSIHSSESQQEFFRMLDEKIEKVNRQKSTSSPEHSFFFGSFMGIWMTEWRIIPSLGPNLCKWGHNRWQNSDSKQKQSVASSHSMVI